MKLIIQCTLQVLEHSNIMSYVDRICSEYKKHSGFGLAVHSRILKTWMRES